MFTGKLKYIMFAVVAVVSIVVISALYRIYWKFSPTKVNGYIQTFAGTTALPNQAAQLVKDQVEFILRSSSLSDQAVLSATVDQIDKEQALVNMAVEMCYSSGLLQRPIQSVNAESTPSE